MKKTYTRLAAVLLGLGTFSASAQLVSTFESFNLQSNAVKNGSGAPVDAKFNSGLFEFPNTYQSDYAYWSDGWAYSTMQDDSTTGYTNLYAAYPKAGNNASLKYAVGQQNSMLRLTGTNTGKVVRGLYLTNGTFAALSMKKGDNIAKKFGGATGTDPDFCVVTIKKFLNGIEGTDSVNCYLADFRSATDSLDYILNTWKWVDLTSLGNVDSLRFYMTSSDNGQFGINTPTFFCIDDVMTNSDTASFENLTLAPNKFWNKRNVKLTNVFEENFAKYDNAYSVSNFGDYWSSGFAVSSKFDTVTAGYGNLYTCYAGKGVDTSKTYAVAQNRSSLIINHLITTGGSSSIVKGLYVTNTTYAALSMKDGDAFGKKFGGATGNDSDYFRLTVKGFKRGTGNLVDSAVTYLADYRSSDNTQDYIQKDWKWVDLHSFGNADSLVFSLTSSDVGQFGMNTPGFFAIDNLTLEMIGGLNDTKGELAVNMYPNPAQNNITVETIERAKITIMDLNGRTLLETAAESANPIINIETLQTGMYIVQVETATGVATKKLLKQ
ncbi:MAG: DUF4465 domain-containing protein [Bacteroidota bacterium]